MCSDNPSPEQNIVTNSKIDELPVKQIERGVCGERRRQNQSVLLVGPDLWYKAIPMSRPAQRDGFLWSDLAATEQFNLAQTRAGTV